MTREKALGALSGLLFLAMLTASIPLVAGFLGRVHPALDSFAHFRWHLAIAMGILAIALLPSRFRLQAVTAAFLAAAALWTTLPGMGLTGGTAAAGDARSSSVYKLLQLNLRFDNRDPGKVLSLIGRLKPDVLTLNEVSTHWHPYIERLKAMYPNQMICPSPRRVGGVAILSRRPLAPGQAIRCTDDGALALARIDFGGRWLEIGATHLHWPWPFQQPVQIESLAPTLAALDDTALVAGDLNAVTWSAAVRRFADAGRLVPIQGIGPTWLDASAPQVLIDYVGLPIDQVFAKGNINLISVARQEPVGSDHLPILVEFSLPLEADDDASVAASLADQDRIETIY